MFIKVIFGIYEEVYLFNVGFFFLYLIVNNVWEIVVGNFKCEEMLSFISC